jgi:transcriptional regulator with XRE-family HTH domain
MAPSKRERRVETLNKAFRSVLRELRRERGWSHGDLGDRAGYVQSFISNIETGKQTPSTTVLFDLLDTLEVLPTTFMDLVVTKAKRKLPNQPSRPELKTA